jgi:type IV pilus assembly protein PilP
MHRVNSPLVRIGRSCLLLALVVAASSLLTACAGDDMDDLRTYVAKEKTKPAGRIPPLPAFETYVTVPYAAGHMRDPFMPFMEAADTGAPQTQAQTQQSNTRPPHTHKPEPLEKFPLDGLKFVGLLERQGERWAIIMAPDKLVHRVKVGNYLGENYGKIVSITETKIELMETVSNGMGGWIESPATLSVVE